jgi:putative drug exporter of the RND superfamily
MNAVTKWVTIAVWLAIAAVAGPLAGQLGDIMDNDSENWLPASAESTQAIRLAGRLFPADEASQLIVVYAREAGLTAADRAAAAHDRTALATLAADRIDERTADDGQAMVLTVPVRAAVLEDPDKVKALVGKARAIVAAGRPPGLQVATTGSAASRADASAANAEVDGTLTAVTVGVVAILLLVIYRSPLLLLLPLLGIGFALVLAQAGVYLLGAHAGVTVSGTSQLLLTVLVFGIGTDYALLLVARYREELRQHENRHHAMNRALRGSAGSMLASTATITLASFALLLADMNSTSGLGPVVAVAVVSVLLVTMTLLPALLVVFGRWLFWPRIPHLDVPAADGVWTRVARLVGRRPRRVWTVTAAGLALLAAGAALLALGGLNGADNYTRPPAFVTGQQLLSKHFPAGAVAPADVYAPTASAVRVASAARATDGVATVGSPSAAQGWARIPVTLTDTPENAADTVDRLRAAVHAVDGRVLVGGRAATDLDTERASTRDLRLIIPVVLLVIVAVLGVLLRAVTAPLLLLGAVLLSTAAAMGMSTVVFHVAGFPKTDPAVLTLGLLFMVTLGVDYTIFLMGRARQEIGTRGHRDGVLHALTATGGVITSAGVVLAATFLVFTVTPVVLNIQLGVFIATGVLIDTFLVRSLLVPALALHLGERTWWPSR